MSHNVGFSINGLKSNLNRIESLYQKIGLNLFLQLKSNLSILLRFDFNIVFDPKQVAAIATFNPIKVRF